MSHHDKHSSEHADRKNPPSTEPATENDMEPVNDAPNPPRTTSGKFTAPKFGSAGSGGAELEPGPERD